MQNKRNILFWICMVIGIGALAFMLGWYISQRERGEVYESMQEEAPVQEVPVSKDQMEVSREEVPVEIPVDFAELKEQNEDIYAWIRIADTVVDYPVVQHPSDDSYYLEYTVDHKKGLPGSLYTESLNAKDFSDYNTVIYGHNMKNGTMFGDLSRYKDAEYMKAHNQIQVYTPEHIYTYQIFAAVTYSNCHLLKVYDFTAESSRTRFLESLSEVRNLSSYIDDSVSVTAQDRILTLSTCTGRNDERFLVEAVLIDEQ